VRCTEQYGSSLPPNDKRPRFDFRTFLCSDYEHLGVKGKLSLELFNDRLMEVSFVPQPAEASGYLKAVAHKEGLYSPDWKDEYHLKRGVTLQSYVPDGGRLVVRWEEPALHEEMNDWIMNFS
jgi:hypothetical protein